MIEKIIRDPVHDVIAFRMDRPVEALLFRLINAAEFQRLRRIRQLGMASLAYPGADHSRYSHSLGVMETARKMLGRIRQIVEVDEAGKTACLCASLLHDLGHGPFSHVFERVSGLDHEDLTRRIIADPASEVNRLLREHDGAMPGLVLELMAGKSNQPFLHDLLSSQLDADRFDYLLRDNLMTGSGYGGYDLQWLLHALTVDEATGRLAVTWKGVSAVEAYLQARYHMYRNVYFHKVVRSAEGMVKLALQRARRLAVQDRLQRPPREHVVHKALAGQMLSVEEFTDLDDISVLHCFKIWTGSSDSALASLCRGLLFRRLYKTIDLSHMDEMQASAYVNAAATAVASAGGDERYDLFLDAPADTPYDIGSHPGSDASGEIMVKMPDGRQTPFAMVSPTSHALARQLSFRRLHVSPAMREAVEKAVG